MKELLEVVTLGAVSEKAEDNCYLQLVEHAEFWLSSVAPQEDWADYLRHGETEYMQLTHCDNPDAVHITKRKMGEWKFSLLPKRYRTAKSAVTKCIERGGNFRDDARNVLGKTAIEKETRLLIATTITPLERCAKAMRTLQSNWSELSEDNQESLRSGILSL